MTSSEFSYTMYPGQVSFGRGKIRTLVSILEPYQRVFVIGGHRATMVTDLLGEHFPPGQYYHFQEVTQHVPQVLVDEAFTAFSKFQGDVLVAMGGGSAVGLAKALALRQQVPIIAIPTTYSGSEMTNIWGISTEDGKKTGRDMAVLPKQVLYDPDLTDGLPKNLAATSAMNAMAHLMEAVYSHEVNPVTYQNALSGMENLRAGLGKLASAQGVAGAINEQLLLGAFLAGKCLCEVPMALHHKAAHVLGGTFGLEHSHVHTVLQAYVLEYQWPYLSDMVRMDFQVALGHDYPPQALQDLARETGAPYRLDQIGFGEKDIERAVKQMLANPYPNPTPLTSQGLTVMLRNAVHGTLNG